MPAVRHQRQLRLQSANYNHNHSFINSLLYTYIHPSNNPCRVLADSSNHLQPSLSLALILQFLTPNLSASFVIPSSNPQTPPGSSPFHTSEAHTLSFRDKRFFFFSRGRSSARRPTPNLEDQSASLSLGHHLRPVPQGRPYQQQATAGTALRILWPLKPHYYDKVEALSVGLLYTGVSRL
jgi:hypothetical protein